MKRRPDLIAQVECPMVFLGKQYPLTLDVYGKIEVNEGQRGIEDIRFESGGEDVSVILDERLMDSIADSILAGDYD